MRKNKLLTAYTIFISIIFAAAVAYFGCNVYTEYSYGSIRTRRTFDELTSSVKKIFATAKNDSVDIPSKISSKVLSLDDYAFLDIKKNGRSLYIYSPKGEAPAENTNMLKIYFNTSKIGDDTIYINAAMYTLRPATIAKYAKYSFLVIFIFTVLTILIIFYINITANSESSNVIETESTDTIAAENNTDSNRDFEFAEPAKDADDAETETTDKTELEQESEQTPKTEETLSDESSLPVDDSKPGNFTEDGKDKTENPKGLFSPATGFGWESYLLTRLDNELVRATSLEFDLILFIIKIEGIERTSERMKDIATTLLNTFQFKDLIFEYKNDCFAAIKTNCGIDDAIPIADSLHNEISKAISEQDGRCFIGLTSRTIRLVSGERLLLEADSALKHAQEDETTPIIAFRANTEKYLDFVDKNN